MAFLKWFIAKRPFAGRNVQTPWGPPLRAPGPAQGSAPPSVKATWCVWWWVWWRVVQAFPLNSMTTVFLYIYLPLITRILHQSTDQSHDCRFEDQRIIGDNTIVPVQKDEVIHRMTTNIHHQAGNNTERPAAILLFIQRNKYGWFEESQSMMKAIWHPESASISPQALKQQSVSLPMKDNLL